MTAFGLHPRICRRTDATIAPVFLDRCDLRVTAFGKLCLLRFALVITGVRAAMIANVVNRLRERGRNDGRLLSLRAAEWLMLFIGGLAGSLILMLR